MRAVRIILGIPMMVVAIFFWVIFFVGETFMEFVEIAKEDHHDF